MKRRVVAGMILAIFCGSAFAGLGSRSAAYVGGTWQLPQETVGVVDSTTDPNRLIFIPNHGEPIGIPYAAVTSLEYGQKAGRRIGATSGWGATTLGLAARFHRARLADVR